MAYEDLRQFIDTLESKGLLKRIRIEVDPIYEITEITDRVSKTNGPALLFEKVKGYNTPVLMNAFGSLERMNLALETDDLINIGYKIRDILEMDIPTGFIEKLKSLPKLAKLASFIPLKVKKGRCQEVIETVNPSLDKLPILKCWPQDGGRFITLPLVFTKDPDNGNRNVGMYRMHVYDSETTGMHWHIHKHGANHYRKYCQLNRRMEVAVVIGTDPAVMYSATAPLPDNIDEMLFAGFLRGKSVELIKCKTIDLEVPANAEFVLEGYVDPHEMRIEGPFGDHTGYYSLADNYPVFHLTCLTHRKNPIYPATIVGKPPMEDCYIGKATERIFLPLLQTQVPEIVDMNLPIFGVFHNFVIISIDKRYPGQAKKVMQAIWGTGQMMFTKIVIVVDKDVNVHNLSEVMWRVGNNIDPQRDVNFVEGPVDVLDHASRLPNLGSKMGIDATKKWKEEGFAREWPDEIKMSEEVVRLVDQKWDEISNPS
ncbi:MAG: menaquinone biosynthesis decarboxylase [bacterium]